MGVFEHFGKRRKDVKQSFWRMKIDWTLVLLGSFEKPLEIFVHKFKIQSK